MPDSEEIHRRAERERQRQAKREEKKNRVKSPKQEMPVSAESFKVFHRNYPYASFLNYLAYIPLLLAAVAWTLWLIDRREFRWIFPYAIGISVLPVAAYTIRLICEAIAYRTYKHWRDDLGFLVNGWDRLGQSPKFPRGVYWDNLEVKVILKSSTLTDTTKLVEDILYLFTIAANRTFYKADFVQPGAAGDLRHKWITIGPLTAKGSANADVMGKLYVCIHKKLRAVHRHTGAVEAVNLVFEKDIFEVRPEEVGD